MIMPRGEQLLLPARPGFIWGSLLVALMLDLLPLGRVPWMPDFLAVVLVFWSIHQPRRVGLAVAFVFGLVLLIVLGLLMVTGVWTDIMSKLGAVVSSVELPL